MIVRMAFLLGVISLGAGCGAAVAKASPEADTSAKQFTAPSGAANVYVFRDESFGGAVKMSVLLDGHPLGDTGPKCYLMTPVAPGPHQVTSKAEKDSTVDFTAQAGNSVYVWQEVKMGILSARSSLKIVDEATAQPRVCGCSLAVTQPQAPLPSAAQPTASTSAVPGS